MGFAHKLDVGYEFYVLIGLPNALGGSLAIRSHGSVFL